MPAALQPHGRSGAADQRRAGASWSIDELPAFDAGVEREIIGIAQEALTNAVRHARARRIVVRAGAVRGVGFRLSVADDGRGIAGDRGAGGFGMTSMRERAERIGASLTFVTAPRAGTEVVLAWQPAAFVDPASRPMAIADARRGAGGGRAGARARVLVVDDHSLLRTGVANIINQEPDLEVVAEAANGRDGVEAFRAASSRRRADGPADAGDGRRRGGPPDSRDRSAGARRSC